MEYRSARPDSRFDKAAPTTDWTGFWVRIICGAMFGIIVGGIWWIQWGLFTESAWLVVPAAGVVFGIAAVLAGDNFESSVRFLRWFRWWW